jgi:hypothetical protein
MTMGDEKTNVTMDANKFYSQASKDLKSTIGGAKVDTAIIYNDTKDSVTHHGPVTAVQDARWCELHKLPLRDCFTGFRSRRFASHPIKVSKAAAGSSR